MAADLQALLHLDQSYLGYCSKTRRNTLVYLACVPTICAGNGLTIRSVFPHTEDVDPMVQKGTWVRARGELVSGEGGGHLTLEVSEFVQVDKIMNDLVKDADIDVAITGSVSSKYYLGHECVVIDVVRKGRLDLQFGLLADDTGHRLYEMVESGSPIQVFGNFSTVVPNETNLPLVCLKPRTVTLPDRLDIGPLTFSRSVKKSESGFSSEDDDVLSEVSAMIITEGYMADARALAMGQEDGGGVGSSLASDDTDAEDSTSNRSATEGNGANSNGTSVFNLAEVPMDSITTESASGVIIICG